MSKQIFYRDEHSTDETDYYCGPASDMPRVLESLKNYLELAIQSTGNHSDGFFCTIVYREMSDEEVRDMPTV